MRCPACGSITTVLETRLAGVGLVVRRRRACACGQRFSTRECVIDETPVAAVPPVVVVAVPVTPEDVTPKVRREKAVVRYDFNAFDDDACFIPEC